MEGPEEKVERQAAVPTIGHKVGNRRIHSIRPPWWSSTECEVQDRRMVRVHPVDEPYIEGRFRSVHKSGMLIRTGNAGEARQVRTLHDAHPPFRHSPVPAMLTLALSAWHWLP